jgi:hypothetical protein
MVLCFAALFMPAVLVPQESFLNPGPGSEPELVHGFSCALTTSMGGTYLILDPSRQGAPLVLCVFETILMAIINPLLAIYAILSKDRTRTRFLLIVGGTIAAGCLTTWIYLASLRITFLFGYYCWLVGIALILIPTFQTLLSCSISWFRDRYGTGPG